MGHTGLSPLPVLTPVSARSDKHGLQLANQVELPGNSEFICNPGKLGTERIGFQGHENRAALREFLKETIDLFFRLAVNI